ncbi:hypothetical protein [Nocardia sp. NPDC004604]|uniref:hypothetical protein n=1 Tax=Nocardia sp. NPDC004604 TaxID=3157013 RepID=UPI0033A0DC3C
MNIQVVIVFVSNELLWQPIELGKIALEHRLAMAPMTRSRETGVEPIGTGLLGYPCARRHDHAAAIRAQVMPSHTFGTAAGEPHFHPSRILAHANLQLDQVRSRTWTLPVPLAVQPATGQHLTTASLIRTI